MKVLTLLQSACVNGCRTTRYGDFVIVTMQGAAFATTAQDFQQAESWARGRTSLGNSNRDRTAYMDRHETVLARGGGGIATKGARSVLARIVNGMKANGIEIKEWSIPHNIFESVEVQKPKVAAVPAATVVTPTLESKT